MVLCISCVNSLLSGGICISLYLVNLTIKQSNLRERGSSCKINASSNRLTHFSPIVSRMMLKTCEPRVSLRGNVNITRIALAETLGETMRNGSQKGRQKSISQFGAKGRKREKEREPPYK